MHNLSIFTAFLFGMLAFFSPCTFPLIPSFLSFLIGISVHHLEDKEYTYTHRKKIMVAVFLYIAGSCITLVILGTVAGSLGIILRTYRDVMQRFGGIIVIIFGLSIMNIYKSKFLSRGFELYRVIDKLTQFRKKYTKSNVVLQYVVAFGLGVVFTIGWIPCISPILGSILLLASSSTPLYGGFLLFIYSLGQNIPLFFVAVLLSSYLGYFKKIRHHIAFLSRITGILLILLGIVMLLGGFSSITQFFYTVASRFSL